MQITDILDMENPLEFFHGSNQLLEVGAILIPSPNYEENWGKTAFYRHLEEHRPDDMPPHKSSVFACLNEEDVDTACGGCKYIYKIEPLGPVTFHDLNWGSEISMFDEDDGNEDEINRCAFNYWAGVAFPHESLVEALMPSARVVEVVEIS